MSGPTEEGTVTKNRPVYGLLPPSDRQPGSAGQVVEPGLSSVFPSEALGDLGLVT